MISGHITICKIYNDGAKETVLDKANLITAGLGSSLSDLFQGKGSRYVEDYTPGYFQVGTGTIGYTGVEASAFFYQLSSPFSWEAYGEDTEVEVEKRYRCFNASTADGGISYSELLLTSAVYSSVISSGVDGYFGVLSPNRKTKFFMDSFESEIVLDEKTGNGESISELGLFINNPRGLAEDSPLLVAYKEFTAIPKTSSFTIVIYWTIGFLGVSNTGDNVFTGGAREVDTIRRGALAPRIGSY